MIFNVIFDLRAFMFMFLVIVSILSMLFAVIGYGNKLISPDPENYFGSEYEHLGSFFGNMILVMRIGLGDYSFLGYSVDLKDNTEHYILYVIFVLIVVVMSIVFMNFLIAEASASYEAVA